MLKRINVKHLKLGMHLHELCGSWMSHPFWRKSFVLEDPKDIQRILDSGIEEAWIDSDKGLDVEFGQTKEETEQEIDRELTKAVEFTIAPQQRVKLSVEMQRAANICAKSREAVVSMFQEARMGKAIEAKDAMPLVEEIGNSVLRNPGALISLARLKRADDYTYMHSVAVCGLMIALANQLRLNPHDTREAGLAGLLHDVGKMAIPLEVLNKPGKLTDAEFALVKSHPEEGHKMLLEGKDISEVALDVCLHHHEKIDGKGYPHRLRGEDISLFSKMGAVCDVYDAITSNRPYKAGWNPAEAIRRMAEWSKSHFEDLIFQAFVKSVGIYPVGTLVRLQSGRLGVIVDQSDRSLLTPQVKVFYSTKSQVRLAPEIVDLASPGCNEKILAHEDPEKWAFPDLEELWRGAGPRPW
ncbi:MAG: HD-GYP domain-containing protein [Proteobacteria bacterium]|nr:HD-GYP domain-containing protein [Pseudomonadota bacterium]